jgi:hypothetical protein
MDTCNLLQGTLLVFLPKLPEIKYGMETVSIFSKITENQNVTTAQNATCHISGWHIAQVILIIYSVKHYQIKHNSWTEPISILLLSTFTQLWMVTTNMLHTCHIDCYY